MKNDNKFKELLKNKEVVISAAVVLGLIVIAVLQFVFKF